MSVLTEYLLVIDTDTYAGNFERELCAFATGMIGECGVGDEEQDLFYEAAAVEGYSLEFPGDDDNLAIRSGDWTELESGFEGPFETIIQSKADDHGCCRPVSIRQSPNKDNYNSLEIYFSELPDDEDFAFIKKRIYQFPDHYQWAKIKILGVRMLQRKIETVETEVPYGK